MPWDPVSRSRSSARSGLLRSVGAVEGAASSRWPVWRSFRSMAPTLTAEILTIELGAVIEENCAKDSGVSHTSVAARRHAAGSAILLTQQRDAQISLPSARRRCLPRRIWPDVPRGWGRRLLIVPSWSHLPHM